MTTGFAPAWRPRTAARSSHDAAPKGANALSSRLPVRNSLPRTVSLKKRSEIESVLKNGARLSGAFCTLRWQSADRFRHAVLVGKKLGGAVQRNRIKRRLREAIRLTDIVLRANISLLIVPRPLAIEPPFDKLKDEIKRLADQIG